MSSNKRQGGGEDILVMAEIFVEYRSEFVEEMGESEKFVNAGFLIQPINQNQSTLIIVENDDRGQVTIPWDVVRRVRAVPPRIVMPEAS